MQTFNAANPYVQGIAGILDAYQNAIRRVQLYGPTNFSPVVNHVSRYDMGKKIQLDLGFLCALIIHYVCSILKEKRIFQELILDFFYNFIKHY